MAATSDQNPFKEGDIVYVHPWGWGCVEKVYGCDVLVNPTIKAKDGKVYDHYERVSFTEYDPIKGGLSHERQNKQTESERIAKELDRIGKAAEKAAEKWSIKFGFPFGQADSHGDVYTKGCFDSNFVKAMKDVPIAGSGRGRKALKYIKKLLKDEYNVVDDFISVEELGDEKASKLIHCAITYTPLTHLIEAILFYRNG